MLIPPLVLIFLVLGTIFLGVATPTEGGAMGATGALVMALARRRLSLPAAAARRWTRRRKLTSFVVFILVGSRVFSLTFYGVDGHLWVEHLLLSLPGGQLGFLIVVNLLVFVLAFFLDFFELAFIVIPLLGPVAEKLGIDLIWFGVLLGVNMQTSFMHPPFGFALFYLRSVAPAKDYVDQVSGKLTARVTTGQIYWGAVPFVADPGHHGRADHRVPGTGRRRPGEEGGGGHRQDPNPGARRTSRRRPLLPGRRAAPNPADRTGGEARTTPRRRERAKGGGTPPRRSRKTKGSAAWKVARLPTQKKKPRLSGVF